MSEQTLLNLLTTDSLSFKKSEFYKLKHGEVGYLNSSEMAKLFILVALMGSSLAYIREQLWLKNKDVDKSKQGFTYEEFLSPLFGKELISILAFKLFLIKSGEEALKPLKINANIIEKKLLKIISLRDNKDQKLFLVKSLDLMSGLFLKEEEDQKDNIVGQAHQGLQLYRTFDGIDEILSLNYNLDKEMVVDLETKERLYQTSGVGVQSGYSTILLSLLNLKLEQGKRIVDLGSGYGRVGIVCSLLRPDLAVSGYEYVPHRVQVSNEACVRLGIESRLKFFTQDLSLKSFTIPDAEVYYLYDPFSKDTYVHVLDQLVDISKRMRIVIITKGNARGWIDQIAESNSWPKPLVLDEGNLCLFHSS